VPEHVLVAQPGRYGRLSPLGPHTSPRRHTCLSGFAGRALSKCAATRKDRARPALHCSAASLARACHSPTPGCSVQYLIVGTPPRIVRLRARGACLAASARTRAFNLPGTKRHLVRSFIWQKARTAPYLLLLVRRTLPARLLQASALVLQDAGLTFFTANRSSRGAIQYNQSEMMPPSARQLHAIGRPWRGAVATLSILSRRDTRYARIGAYRRGHV
jgi:hypothetical protein